MSCLVPLQANKHFPEYSTSFINQRGLLRCLRGTSSSSTPKYFEPLIFRDGILVQTGIVLDFPSPPVGSVPIKKTRLLLPIRCLEAARASSPMANHPSTPILLHWSPTPLLISHQASGSSTPLGAALGIGSPSGHRRNGGCTGPRRARDRCRHREGWCSVLWRQMCQSEPQLTVRWTGHGGAGSEGVATARAR